MCNIRQKLQEDYIEYHSEDIVQTSTAQYKAIELIPDNSIVLDVGCGNGTGKVIANKINKNIKEYIGIDFHKDTLNKAANNLDRFINADIENLPEDILSENYFDVIMFNDVVEHLVYPENALKNFIRFLKPDGVFIMSIPNVGHQSVILNIMLNGLWYDDGVACKEHLRFFTLKEILKFLDSLNLTVSGNIIATTTEIHPIMNNMLNSVKGVLANNFNNQMMQASVVQYVFKAVRTNTINNDFAIEFVSNQLINL